ncbi:MAG: hypothetical protein SOT81_07605 [Treponema sp.]|nr:hypothetical protein [Treponema sp.]
MSRQKFSGIESDFIKKYLADEKRELEISEFGENDSENEKSENSVKIFTDVHNQKKYVENHLLKICASDGGKNSESLLKPFLKKKILVSFYFNSLGLCFASKIASRENSFFVVLPDDFYSIKEKNESSGEISAVIFYDCGALGKSSGKRNIPINCTFDEDFKLFESPKFDSPDENLNSRIKIWISKLFSESKKDKKSFGNGLFLIQAGKYLLREKKNGIESIQGRKKTPALIYLDDERIVFASEKEDMILSDGKSYSFSLFFPLPPPLKKRVIDLVFTVEDVFSNQDGTRLCAFALISEIKAEDKRFLGEMMSR